MGMMKQQTETGNKVAPKGYVFVCLACGKRSRDRYGMKPISYGWDVSCTLNCDMFREEDLVLNEHDGRVTEIKANTNAPKATEQELDGE